MGHLQFCYVEVPRRFFRCMRPLCQARTVALPERQNIRLKVGQRKHYEAGVSTQIADVGLKPQPQELKRPTLSYHGLSQRFQPLSNVRGVKPSEGMQTLRRYL